MPPPEAAALRRRREDRLLADNLELQTSERLSHEIFRFAQVGLCLAREDGTIVRVNPEFARIFGCDPGELEGRPVATVLPEHVRAHALERLGPAVEGEGEPLLWSIRARDGETREVRSWVRRFEQEGRHYLLGSFQDVTAQRAAERRIRALYRISGRLQHAGSLSDVYEFSIEAILEAMGCDRASIRLFDEAGVMRFVAWRGLSAEYRRATESHSPWKTDAREPLPITMSDVTTAPMDERLRGTVRSEGIRAVCFIPLVADDRLIGQFMAYFDAPHAFSEEEIGLCVAVGRDLALGIEHKRVEENLRVQGERLRLATLTGKIGIWDWDIQSDRVSWTDSLYQIHGVEKGAFEGTSAGFISLVHPDDRPMARAAIRQTLEGKAPYELELRAIRRDGTLLWIFTTATVIKSGGRVVRMIGATVDITERKRAEEALKDADRRKDEFLAMLSHELRNPLGAITSAAAILRHTPSPDATVEMARDIIDRQTGHLTRLVDDLLDLSRITRGKIAVDARRISAADAISLAAETIRSSLEERRQELIVSLPPVPVEVRADVGRIAQAIGNLLHNASKYSRDGGRIWLSLQREGSDAVVRVRDSGMGIDPALLPRVFDPFVQGAWELEPTLDQSRRGLGLGLTLVRSIVELHGGSVVATSAGPGEGSEFAVRLPALSSQPRDAVPSADQRSAPAAAARRVLIVDDSADSAEGLAKLLEMSGHAVRTSHDGESALVAAADFHPDVVLLDIGLPGIDGYETARRMRALPDLAEVDLVALTGYGREEDREKAREAGFDRHVVKPIRADALLKLIDASRPGS